MVLVIFCEVNVKLKINNLITTEAIIPPQLNLI